MTEPRKVRIALGRRALVGVAREPRHLDAAAKLVHAREDKFAERVELAGASAWLKCDPVDERARWRHSVRHWLGAPALSVNEFRRLRWLREHGFRAPEPLAAGVIVERGVVRRHFVATAWLPTQRSLDVALRDAAPEQRKAWLDDLARDVARLHALDFIHRDLFWRNLLVDDAPRVFFIDCRRAGPPRRGRDANYDLGCLMLEGAGLLGFDEQREFFVRYFSERAAHRSPADRQAALGAANQCRDALLDQIALAPGRWRSPEPPLAKWAWRDLASALA